MLPTPGIAFPAGRLTLARAPAGLDALALGDVARLRLAAHRGGAVAVLHIARNELRLAELARCLAFFAPEVEVLALPAWDCLPYDRVGPNPVAASRRLATLARLAELAEAAPAAPVVLVTTVSAALQRVPTAEFMRTRSWSAAAGADIDTAALIGFLDGNGYRRAGTVVEPGEYAVRGGIIDVFATGQAQPVRLDLFGRTLESVRAFDPETQRTTAQARRVTLLPVSEVVLSAEAVARFRAGYVAAFGTVTSADPLYEAVSAGQRQRGMEHWLPLFHDKLATVFQAASGALVSLDHLAGRAAEERLALIADHHANRQTGRAEHTLGVPPYHPLAPTALYLGAPEWAAALAGPHLQLTPFDPGGAEDGGAGEGGRAVDLGAMPARSFAPERNEQAGVVFEAARAHIADLQGRGLRVILAAASDGAGDRLAGLLADQGLGPAARVADLGQAMALPPATVALATLELDAGFTAPGHLAVVSEQDILGERMIRHGRKARRAQDFLTEVTALSPGDLVVHVDHGIGRFEGLRTIEAAGAPHDCLELHYLGSDKLYLPVENIELLSRYGHDEAGVALDRLGGAGWQARKARARERIREMAGQLIKVAAARELKSAPRFTPDPVLMSEFASRFPFEATDDQAAAIDTVLADLAGGRAMDRLICGDVGFGKTEVALRSAFVVAGEGAQVAVVAPTTLLARQHHQTFTRRFAGFPINIARASRLVGSKELAETRAGLKSGRVDIVIGTHALLSKSIEFADLALLIVDEEQHFGVAHKERLKELRHDVHVLTLTATPIPRTLQLALSGVRDLTLIATPPVDRLAVRTFIAPFDPVIVREALLRELYRGGQSFFVCPRIADLGPAAELLAREVPEVKVAVAHGQMAARALDDVMNAFYEGEFDVLLSTAIIESGLDIPTANTLIVHRADKFGLAQLYQLRGRVGRAKARAYALFTMPADFRLGEVAERRLTVLQSLDSLGAGFTLASHDLDIRGAGNLLGEEQSGHIREVGFELYQSMLEEAVASLRAGAKDAEEAQWSPTITVGAAVMLPETYVPDLRLRLGLYRRLAELGAPAALDAFAAELVDRFGPLPEEVGHLLRVVAIKQLAHAAGIGRFDAGPKGAVIAFRDDRFANPAGLIEWIQSLGAAARMRPDHRLVVQRDWAAVDERLRGAEALVRQIAGLVGTEAAAA
jgi:transcription-repair coupling factor (superfamily II helicase)